MAVELCAVMVKLRTFEGTRTRTSHKKENLCDFTDIAEIGDIGCLS